MLHMRVCVYTCAEYTITSVARVFVSLLVAFSYPLQCNPARSSALALWQMVDATDAD